ncbi:MAG TPA: APC family permease [Planctomycetes bacterium]|nr:APC family permease [Planctomycetota bacterium]
MRSKSGSAAQGGKTLGVVGAVAIGIGGMVGGGIFAVLGEAVSLAHGATPVAFSLAGLIALMTAYSYARLSVAFPSQGGTVVFLDRAFRKDLATGALNTLLWVSYLVTLALYASAFGAYALTFVGEGSPGWVGHALVSLGIILPVGINLFGSAIVSRSETTVVVVKLVLLALVIIAGWPFLHTERLATSSWGSPLSLIAAGMTIFVAYEGFELIANASADAREPRRTLPRAFFISVGLVIALYVLIAVVVVGSVPADRIAAVKDYALAEAARPALGEFGFRLVGLSALLATFSAINATIYGSARLGFVLARDGELPAILERRCWNEPAFGILLIGAISLLLANLLDIEAIASVASSGFLLIFGATNLAAFRLADDIGANRWVPLTGGVACLGALIVLLASSWRESPEVIWLFVVFVVGALVFEVTYGRLKRGPFKVWDDIEKVVHRLEELETHS